MLDTTEITMSRRCSWGNHEYDLRRSQGANGRYQNADWLAQRRLWYRAHGKISIFGGADLPTIFQRMGTVSMTVGLVVIESPCACEVVLVS